MLQEGIVGFVPPSREMGVTGKPWLFWEQLLVSYRLYQYLPFPYISYITLHNYTNLYITRYFLHQIDLYLDFYWKISEESQEHIGCGIKRPIKMYYTRL